MKRLTVILMLLLIGGIQMTERHDVSTTLSFDVNAATNYLETRPGSDKSYNALTHAQLLDFLDALTVEVTNALDGLYDVDRTLIADRLATYTGLLDGLTETTFNSDKVFYYGIYEGMFELYSYTLESRNVEGRGMWHRPFESDLTQVRDTLQELQDMGINMLYVETFWMGRLIYNSDIPGTFQHHFTLAGYTDGTVDYGTNLLEAFVEEGKRYGIEVHAWVENFFVGYGDSYTSSPILNANPDWALYNYDGTIPQKQEVNYIFMDPANPEVRDYVKAIYGEMAGKYDIASIHLDYIRYPVVANTTNAGSSNRDNGYSDYAEREFKTLYGYTGDLRELVVTDSQAAADWKDYKKNVISDFVAGVYYTVKNQNPDIYLSTAIFGNVSHALQTKMQDWPSWIEDGLIELILPMAYYQSSITVRSEVGNLTTTVDQNAYAYAGIAPSFMGYNDHLNTTQIEASLNGHAMGATFFASQNYLSRHFNGLSTFNTKVQNILTNGVYRTPAIVPHGDTTEVINRIFDLMLSKADRIYVPEAAMTPTQRTNLESTLATYRAMQHGSATDLTQLIDALETMQGSTYATAPASTRLEEDIQYLIDILTIKARRLNFDDTIDISVNPDPNTYFPDLVQLDAPTNLRVEGDLLLWDGVTSPAVTAVNVNDTIVQVVGGVLNLTEVTLRDGINVIGVYAVGDGVYTTDSEYSNILQYEVTKLPAPEQLHIIDNVLHFDEVEGAEGYIIHIGLDEIVVDSNQYDLTSYATAGTTNSYYIQVQTIGNDYTTLTSNYTPRLTYRTGEESLEARISELFIDFIKHSINQEQEEE